MENNKLLELYEALNERGIIKNKRDFAIKLGIQESNATRYINGEVRYIINNTGFYFFKENNISLEWFIAGQGEMFLDAQSQTNNSTAAVTLKEALPIIAELADLTAQQKQEILDFIKEIKK